MSSDPRKEPARDRAEETPEPRPAHREASEPAAADETPPAPRAGLGYTFKFARLDPGSAFEFEDTADK